MIKVQQMTKRYGPLVAVDSLNFSVAKGEVVGFLGPNGAGKSTTMKIITGFMAPTSGQVSVGGFDVLEDPIEVKKRIGYLPETPPLYLDMVVKDYLAYVAKLKGVAKGDVSKAVASSIEKASLGEVQNRLIMHLSKGFRQRVGLAQALVSDPEVLILDEPTVGLDPKQVAEVRTLIQGLAGQHTIVLSTHILPEVQASCERIIIIDKGKIVAEDTLEGLNRRMSGGRRVIVRTRKENGLLDSLKGIKGVLHVGKGASKQTLELDTDQNEEVLEKISAHIVGSGAGLLEIRSLDLSLEDIFLKVTDTAN